MSRVALCLITKDASATIDKLLDSIRPFVDGIFVYDTGSTDDTLEKLAKVHNTVFVNAETGEWDRRPMHDRALVEGSPWQKVDLAPIVVERGEWRDDFSWARTQSFAMVPDEYDWVIWADDDDEIAGAHNIRTLMTQAPPELDGFVVEYDYARDEHGNCVCTLWRERLLRRDAGYTWKNAVHEVLIPPDGRTPKLAFLSKDQLLYIHHRPADRYDPARNLDILRRVADEAAAQGEQPDPRTLAYLGTELMTKGEWVEAAGHLQAYLDRPDAQWSDERMQVAHKLAICARALGNANASVEIEMQALRERDDWAETYVGLSEGFALLERWDRVERWAKRAIELGTPQTPLIVNPLEFTLLPMLRLSEACKNQGRLDEAEQWLARAAAAAPGQGVVAERIKELAQAKLEHEALKALLTLREVLVRHDENEKAHQLMEHAVPYLVAENPMVIKARADQREMVAHILRPEEYRRWYEDEPKDSTITDDIIDDVGEWMGRVKGLIRGLEEQEATLGRKPVVLDLGCNDWWMGELLARKGYRCDGVELNKRSFEKAIERRDRFERDATIVQGDLHEANFLLREQVTIEGHKIEIPGVGLYDAVVLFEVFEHVPDTTRTLAVMESMLAPGGRVYLSTPAGAFEKGLIPDWQNVVRKGHVRALPLHELADELLDRGDIDDLEETNGDRVAFASYTPKQKRGTVAFYAGGQWEPWSPLSIRNGGIGGSETALVQVATRLAADGYKVKVYSSSEPGLIGGVLYRPFTAWDPTENVDLLVVSRRPDLFDNPLGAKTTALWCHDHSYESLTAERAEKIDHIVCLSDWQRDRFARLYPFAADRLTIIRNGISYIDLDGTPRYTKAACGFAKRKLRAVYSSSADRGLDVLLDLWPRIRARAPKAELHVFYGFNVLDKVAAVNPQLAAFKQAILGKVAELGGETGGIHLRGRVGQAELADEMQQARVLTYPTAFLETSCITAMEAKAAGLPIVTSDLGALHETAAGQTLLPWAADETGPHNRDEGYQDAFVDAVVAMLTDKAAWQPAHDEALRGAETLDWSRVIPQWAELAAGTAETVATTRSPREKAVA